MKSDKTSKVLLISERKLEPHSKIKEILQKSEDISKQLGIVLEDYYSGYDTMSSYLYPDGNVSNVIDVTVFYNILYYFDELFGEDTKKSTYIPSMNDILKIWLTGKIEGKNSNKKEIIGLVNGMNKIKEILNKADSRLANRIQISLMKHLKDSLQPKDFNNIDEYIETRLEFSGMFLTIDMMQYIYEIYLEEVLLQKIPSLNKARILSVELGALSNDIFSFPKETDSQFNLINVIMKLDKCDVTKAIDKSIELVNKKYLEFKMNINNTIKGIDIKLSSDEIIIVKKYIKGLLDIVSASYYWQLSTKRYKNPLHFFLDMK